MNHPWLQLFDTDAHDFAVSIAGSSIWKLISIPQVFFAELVLAVVLVACFFVFFFVNIGNIERINIKFLVFGEEIANKIAFITLDLVYIKTIFIDWHLCYNCAFIVKYILYLKLRYSDMVNYKHN